MYKAILVDDDKIIRKSIIQSANWEESGFSFAGEAYNGSDALKKVEELCPELVITDICMPSMDGIELIQRVKEKFPHIKFIVLSNYDDFKYVKTALKNGALDYILKYEITGESLNRLLRQARDVIDQETRNVEMGRRFKELESRQAAEKLNNFWMSLEGDRLPGKALEEAALSHGIRLSPLHGVILMSRCGENGTAENFKQIMERIRNTLKGENPETDVYTFQLESRIFGLFANFKWCLSNSEALMAVMEKVNWLPELKAVRDVNYIFSISDVFHNAEGMQAYAVKCREMLKTAYYNPADRVITPRIFLPFLKGIDLSKYEKEADGILQSLIAKKLSDAYDGLGKLFKLMKEDYIDPDLTSEIYHYLIHELNGICRLRNMEDASFCPNGTIPLDILDGAEDIETAEKGIRELLGKIDRNLYTAVVASDNEEIKKATDYIARNHSRPIGLQEVADFVGLSKNHFCRLFKQQTGENFLDYLNKVRIERAKQLLANTGLNINDISQHVGYSDYRYFKQVFFKYTGLFPSELRKNRIQ